MGRTLLLTDVETGEQFTHSVPDQWCERCDAPRGEGECRACSALITTLTETHSLLRKQARERRAAWEAAQKESPDLEAIYAQVRGDAPPTHSADTRRPGRNDAMTDDAPFCIRCGEDFPVSPEPASWSMGTLRPLARAPQRLRDRLRYDPADMRGTPHLCGNCYFDLTD